LRDKKLAGEQHLKTQIAALKKDLGETSGLQGALPEQHPSHSVAKPADTAASLIALQPSMTLSRRGSTTPSFK
jgi:hypothetical protein